MKKLLSILIIILFNQSIFSQDDFNKTEDDIPTNTATLEFFGHSLELISFNYERLFNPINKHLTISARSGVGLKPSSEYNGEKFHQRTTVPFVISAILGKKINYVQFGLGYSATFTRGLVNPMSNETYKRYESAYSMSLGYRLVYKHLIVQGYPMLIWTNNFDEKPIFSFGLSCGGVW